MKPKRARLSDAGEDAVAGRDDLIALVRMSRLQQKVVDSGKVPKKLSAKKVARRVGAVFKQEAASPAYRLSGRIMLCAGIAVFSYLILVSSAPMSEGDLARRHWWIAETEPRRRYGRRGRAGRPLDRG